MRVIAVPIQNVLLHVDVISRNVSRWIPHVVKLVPQQSLVATRRRHDVDLERHLNLRHAQFRLSARARRGDGESHAPTRDARLGRRVVLDSHIQRQEPRVRPKRLRKREANVEVRAQVVVVRYEIGPAHNLPVRAETVHDRRVQHQRHHRGVDSLFAVRPSVRALRQVKRRRNHRGARRVRLQNLRRFQQIQLPRPLLVAMC